MNELQWYLIAVVLVVVVLVCAGLWWCTGTTPAPVVVVVDPEPTYKITEKYGRHVVREISTEYGESKTWSEFPGVYYEVSKSWFGDDGKRRWSSLCHFTELSKAEEHLLESVAHDAEKNKVRPSWEYRKDGTPYLKS